MTSKSGESTEMTGKVEEDELNGRIGKGVNGGCMEAWVAMKRITSPRLSTHGRRWRRRGRGVACGAAGGNFAES